MVEIFLSPGEVTVLTNKQRRQTQAKVLNIMGIEHKVRPDGSIAILRAHINKIFGGDVRVEPKVTNAEPNWAIFN